MRSLSVNNKAYTEDSVVLSIYDKTYMNVYVSNIKRQLIYNLRVLVARLPPFVTKKGKTCV